MERRREGDEGTDKVGRYGKGRNGRGMSLWAEGKEGASEEESNTEEQEEEEVRKRGI